MILTTFAPSEHTAAELAAVIVEVKYDGRVCDIGPELVSELELSRVAPIRISKAYPGRDSYSGVYWSATTGRHHWFESLYEKTALSVLDRDPAVADIATQPFKLRWGRLGMTHFPDFLIRRSDGSRLIVDVRPRRRIKARDAELFAVTAAWAASLEMGYRLFADLSKVQDWNIRLLAGYRHPRWACPAPVAEMLTARRGEARALRDWEHLLGGTRSPARGLILAAIWHGALEVDLGRRLEFDSVAVCAGRGWG
ncbi:TnsA-like heteromeric transposase endonuclease subunit [Microbacterium sp. 179-I 1D1 NHS]|uniref:TnsA-like heteromeric transposase endonuclease subunit n=1 Tax=Microbacterium sp. 179-I 1D1 NHS TaxID=3374298 RepID=UPI0038799CFB